MLNHEQRKLAGCDDVSVTLALQRERQEDQKLKVNLSHTLSKKPPERHQLLPQNSSKTTKPTTKEKFQIK